MFLRAEKINLQTLRQRRRRRRRNQSLFATLSAGNNGFNDDIGDEEDDDEDLASWTDVSSACKRLELFLDQKRDLFGTSRLTKNITLEDLDEDDLRLLHSGYVQLLPGRDRAGRAITLSLSHLRQNSNIKSIVSRIFWKIPLLVWPCLFCLVCFRIDLLTHAIHALIHLYSCLRDCSAEHGIT